MESDDTWSDGRIQYEKIRFAMNAHIKVTKPNRLQEEETLTSFEDWKNNLKFYLSQNEIFKHFLNSETVWEKTSSGVPFRGLRNHEDCQHLQHFLGKYMFVCLFVCLFDHTM